MTCFGSLIGLVVEAFGSLRDADGQCTEENFLTSSIRTPESINGLIGVYRHISKRTCLISGNAR